MASKYLLHHPLKTSTTTEVSKAYISLNNDHLLGSKLRLAIL